MGRRISTADVGVVCWTAVVQCTEGRKKNGAYYISINKWSRKNTTLYNINTRRQKIRQETAVLGIWSDTYR